MGLSLRLSSKLALNLAHAGLTVAMVFRNWMNTSEATDQLCLACGLCCNGVLFRDVELQPGDDQDRLEKLGLPVRARLNGALCVPQPCAALCADNRCRLYADRPRRCRDFECGVLKEVISNQLALAEALKIVRRAQRHADRVRALLRELGDNDEHRPLSQRFRRTRRRIESSARDERAGDLFAELTLEVHQLNLVTHSRFYTREDVFQRQSSS